MGDQHRSDTDRAPKADQDHDVREQARAAKRDAEDAQFDPEHAKTQLAYHAKRTTWDQPASPVHTVGAVGNADVVDTMRMRFDAAKKAQNAAEGLSIVRDMDTARRAEVAGQLDDLATVLSPRDVLFVARVAQASVDATLLALLKASPPVRRDQIRAYLPDVSPYLIDRAF